jgi:hypothetical protein
MDEVIFLFLYHKLDAATQRHFELLRRQHPRDRVVPLGYQFKIPKLIEETVDVALDWDYGWPIYSTWHEVDKIFLRWFLKPGQPQARRYVFFEFDILATIPAQQFYGSAWNTDAAATCVLTPEKDPKWHWWIHASRLGDAFPMRQGAAPLAATLWSHEALDRISRTRRFQDCYCELRMATLAKVLGFHCAAIDGAHKTVSSVPTDIQVHNRPAWFHPVKA